MVINNTNKDKAEELVNNSEASQKLIIVEKRANNDKGMGKNVTPILNQIPEPPSPFSQSLKKGS